MRKLFCHIFCHFMLLKEEVCIVADVSLKDMTYRGECVDV